jgi:translation initiation factor 4E
MSLRTAEYDVWLFRRDQTGKMMNGSKNYEDMLEHIGSFDSVEKFWGIYSHLKRPANLPSVNLSVFRKGIKPLWEDEANKKGGKFGIKVKKGISSHCWEALLLAVVGNQLGVGPDEICGVTISIRSLSCDIMTLWIRTSDNMTKIQRMKQRIRFLLELPDFVTLDFKPHYSDTAFDSSTSKGGRGADRTGGERQRGSSPGMMRSRKIPDRSGSWNRSGGGSRKGSSDRRERRHYSHRPVVSGDRSSSAPSSSSSNEPKNWRSGAW